MAERSPIITVSNIGPKGYAEAWSPGDGVTAHNGATLPTNHDFFQAPPNEIGAVISAYSTLSVGQQPWSTAVRGILVAGTTSLIYGLLYWASSGEHRPQDPPWYFFAIIMPSFVIAFTIWIIVWFTRFRHRCSYVGKVGAALYQLVGTRHQLESNVLLFSDFEERTGSPLLYPGTCRRVPKGSREVSAATNTPPA